ncbi:uncharacterized protein [Dipodomys merriami]|uniref:uncharacterized protein isoform X2 n=1 Tax=Dipodomys merriami TaxID=94247 RepID=UPI0038559589
MIRSFCRSVYYWFVYIRRHNRVVHATTDTGKCPETKKTDDNILTEVVISSNENDITCPEKTEPQEIISKHVKESNTDLLDIVISSGNNTTTDDSDTVLAVVNNTTGLDKNNAGDLILEDVDERDIETMPAVVVISGNNTTTGDSDTVLAVVNNTTGLDKNNAGDLILEDVDERDIETMPAVVVISGNNTTTGDSDTVLAVVNNTTGDIETIPEIVITSGNNKTTGDTDTIPDIVIGSGNFMTTGVNASEVPHVGTSSQSISTYELHSFPEGRRTSSEWAFELSALNKSVDLSEVLPVPLLGILTDEPCPYEICKGRERPSDEWAHEMLFLNKSVDLSEVLPVPLLGIGDDEPSPYECAYGRERPSDEWAQEMLVLNKSVDLSEVLPVPLLGIDTEEDRPYELCERSSSSEWAFERSALSKSVDLSEVLPVPLLGIVDDEPCPYELCSIPDSERVISCDYLSVYEEEINDGSKLSTKAKEIHPSEATIKTILSSDSTMESVEEDRSKCDPKKILRFIMTSLPFRILGILLFLIDLVFTVVDILVPQSEDYIPFQYRVTSLGISLFFLIEVLLQIYADGKKHYFSDTFNILDTLIVGVTFCIDIIYMFLDLKIFKDMSRVIAILRPLQLITLLRLLHLVNQRRHLEEDTRRRLISGDTERYSNLP